MEYHNFDYFLTIVETGNITRAAEKHYISQPSMTQYLNKLEKRLGVKLFDRSSTPLSLTKAGEIFLSYVKKCTQLDHELERELEAVKTAVTGSVRFGIPLQMQQILVRDLIPPFMEQNPFIDISIRDDASPALEKAVMGNRVDCALVYNQAADKKGLVYHALKKERIFFICRKDQYLASGRESDADCPLHLSLSDVSGQTFYLMENGFIIRSISDTFFRQHLFTPRKWIAMSSMSALLQIVSNGGGITFVPEYVISSFHNKDSLAFLTIEEQEFSMNLSLIYRSGRELSLPVEALVRFIQQYYRERL